MSKEYKNYLKLIKRNNLLIRISQILIFIIFIVAWQLLADFKIINTFIFSSPIKIFNCLVNLASTNNLYDHILITIYETLISFALATLLGLLIASLMWWNIFIAKVIDPYLTIINSLPKVALGPIIIIWIGANMNSIIVMALLISLIVTIINLYQSFIETDPNKIKLMKSLKANNRQIFFKLILPNSFSNIINVLKINISMSLIGL